MTDVAAAPTSHTPAPPTPGRVRYIGIDLARLTAIAGMMAAHLIGLKAMIPNTPDFEQAIAEATELVTSGTAAALFAVLGGLSMVFATRRFLRDGRTGAAIGSIAMRGAVLIVIGMLLGILDSDIVVVLAFYGLAMIVVAPLIAARGWVLATIATVLGLAGGVLNVHARRALEVYYEGKSVSFDLLFTDPITALRALLLTGEYPVITWAVYLLVGILIGRLFVAATARGGLGRIAARTAGIGAVIMLAAQLVSNWVLANLTLLDIRSRTATDQAELVEFISHMTYGSPAGPQPWLQLAAVPHTGSIGDLVRTIGLSLAVIGALVWLCDRESVRGRKTGRIVGVLRATGGAPLTVYTLHIIVSALLLTPFLRDPSVFTQGGIAWWAAGPGAFALQFGGALVIGAVLSATGKRGPLEALLSKLVGLVVPARPRSSAVPGM